MNNGLRIWVSRTWAHKMADVYIDKDFTRIDLANRRMIDLLMGKEEKDI